MRLGYQWRPYPGQVVGWFALTPDAPYRLRIGAPLKPHVDVSVVGGALKLGYAVVDREGRQYHGPRLESPPRFAVCKNGKEIGSGTFQYG